jgi:hypothetical protein
VFENSIAGWGRLPCEAGSYYCYSPDIIGDNQITADEIGKAFNPLKTKPLCFI